MTRAVIVTGLGFGDEGKGTTVDFLARQALNNGESVAVVRHNGGPQAAHNVVTPDGRHHTFSQFGSASFLGVETYLSQMMLVNPLNLFNEAVGLMKVGVPDPLRLLTVSPEAYVITPWHRALNRVREASRGEQRHGSCGQGVGEVMARITATSVPNLRVGELSDRSLSARLNDLKQDLGDEAYDLASRFRELVPNELLDPFRSGTHFRSDSVKDVAELYQKFAGTVKIEDRFDILAHAYDLIIFEGAQGVLLDEHFGFHPHTTWSTTTARNVMLMVERSGFAFDDVQKLGVTRTYLTRHGAGPFVTEDPTLDHPEAHNGTGKWQGTFRLGHMDIPMLEYAVEMNRGISGLVVTHLDRVQSGMKLCFNYDRGKSTLPLRDIAWMERNDKTWRRQLTEKVSNLRPIYKALNPAPTPMEYAEMLADSLNVPLHSVSSGPTADDKRLLESITA